MKRPQIIVGISFVLNLIAPSISAKPDTGVSVEESSALTISLFTDKSGSARKYRSQMRKFRSRLVQSVSPVDYITAYDFSGEYEQTTALTRIGNRAGLKLFGDEIADGSRKKKLPVDRFTNFGALWTGPVVALGSGPRHSVVFILTDSIGSDLTNSGGKMLDHDFTTRKPLSLSVNSKNTTIIWVIFSRTTPRKIGPNTVPLSLKDSMLINHRVTRLFAWLDDEEKVEASSGSTKEWLQAANLSDLLERIRTRVSPKPNSIDPEMGEAAPVLTDKNEWYYIPFPSWLKVAFALFLALSALWWQKRRRRPTTGPLLSSDDSSIELRLTPLDSEDSPVEFTLDRYGLEIGNDVSYDGVQIDLGLTGPLALEIARGKLNLSSAHDPIVIFNPNGAPVDYLEPGDQGRLELQHTVADQFHRPLFRIDLCE